MGTGSWPLPVVQTLTHSSTLHLHISAFSSAIILNNTSLMKHFVSLEVLLLFNLS